MKAVKRAIILCWIMLVACFIIKLFGGNWFEIICTNKHFISICNFIDKHIILQDIIAFILYVPSTFLILMSCSLIPKPNKKQILIISISLVVVWCSRYIHPAVKSVLEAVNTIAMPLALRIDDFRENGFSHTLKKVWYYGFIGCALIVVFQAISLIARNIGFNGIEDNTVISLILLVDYYIMIVLYYLYIRLKKGVKQDG